MCGVASAKTYAPGALHHIIVRGIERGKISSDDQDRDNFTEHLGDIITETQSCCFAWALIPNHAHILCEPAKFRLLPS
jgi:putative transposase